MAGQNPDFAADEFREGIQFVMSMGAPPDEANQATFHFDSILVYNKPTDAENVPFDPTATVTRTTPLPVRLTECAIEYFDAQGELTTGFGLVTPTRVTITVLDEQYELIAGCSYVVIGGDKYNYRHMEPPSGLFDVGVFTLYFTAETET